MNRRDLRGLADTRLAEAQILFSNRKYDAAYHLAGYAVECALKACIAKKTRRYDFPDKDIAGKVYTHRLRDLGGDQSLSEVALTTIDKLVAELALPRVDMIKMDIEGAERQALAGARATVAKFRPRLAVAVEHFPDDIEKIPALFCRPVARYVGGMRGVRARDQSEGGPDSADGGLRAMVGDAPKTLPLDRHDGNRNLVSSLN